MKPEHLQQCRIESRAVNMAFKVVVVAFAIVATVHAARVYNRNQRTNYEQNLQYDYDPYYDDGAQEYAPPRSIYATSPKKYYPLPVAPAHMPRQARLESRHHLRKQSQKQGKYAPATFPPPPAEYFEDSETYSNVEATTQASYEFEYAVNDPHTGDSKSQKEVRTGDSVKGSYSMVDADGTKHIVEYTADAKNGYQAVVRTERTQLSPVNQRNQFQDEYDQYESDPAAYKAPVYQTPQAIDDTEEYKVPVAYKRPVAPKAPVVYKAPVAYKAPAVYKAPVPYKPQIAYKAQRAHKVPVAYKAPMPYHIPAAYKAPVAPTYNPYYRQETQAGGENYAAEAVVTSYDSRFSNSAGPHKGSSRRTYKAQPSYSRAPVAAPTYDQYDANQEYAREDYAQEDSYY